MLALALDPNQSSGKYYKHKNCNHILLHYIKIPQRD